MGICLTIYHYGKRYRSWRAENVPLLSTADTPPVNSTVQPVSTLPNTHSEFLSLSIHDALPQKGDESSKGGQLQPPPYPNVHQSHTYQSLVH